MFKKYIILVILLLAVVIVGAQEHNASLTSLDLHFSELNKKGMLVLGSWGAANLLAGSALTFSTQGKAKYFWQMSAAWNTINLGIAASAYFGGTEAANLGELLTEIHGYQKAYLFNAGLDVGYIMTGFLLREIARSKTQHHDRLTAYGNAIIVQGAFLMVFDLAMYAIHQQQYQLKLIPWVDTLTSISGLSISWQF